MSVKQSILDAIGKTPLLDIDGFYVKCEFLNPSGSIKDRIGQYFIERAEQTGKLKKTDTIVEASTGNTGTALAMLGAAKGYKVIIYMARGLSRERYKMIKAFNAEIRLVHKNRTDIAVQKARALKDQPGYYHPDQFSNPWNVEEHENFTAQEIIKQLDGKRIDAVVAGIGSGGTIVQYEFKSLKLIMLTILLIYNITEAAIARLHIGWFLFLTFSFMSLPPGDDKAEDVGLATTY